MWFDKCFTFTVYDNGTAAGATIDHTVLDAMVNISVDQKCFSVLVVIKFYKEKTGRSHLIVMGLSSGYGNIMYVMRALVVEKGT